MASVIGLGFVGSALYKSFALKNVAPLGGYDKFKNGGIGSLEECMETPIIFLSLPTLYDHDSHEYDKTAIKETLANLSNYNYAGVVVLKSTVEPGTTDELSERFPSLSILHNPEFLSATTAFEDFHHQDHVVLGQGKNCTNNQLQQVYEFYQMYYEDAEISTCTSLESESMKCFVNCFYSVKIQFFNELYLLCKHQGSDFNIVKNLMLKNKWINPMHTSVPGHDGKLSYGGACFPKDTNALLQCMKKNGTPHGVLEGCVRERNVLRGDSELNEKIVSGSNAFNHNGNYKNGTLNSKINDVVYEKILNSSMLKGRVKNGHYS